MRRLFLAISILCAALFFGGCADPVVMSEALQQTQGQKIYTRYNLWYQNPQKISSLNIQQGTFLPLGSEIEAVGSGQNYITGNSTLTFRDMEGREYTIVFDPGYRLSSLRTFIHDTFTTEPPEVTFANIPPDTLERIKGGFVVAGMNRLEVMLAYGPPPAIRTPNLRNETWVYWISPSDTVRVIFRGDVVRNILNVNE